MTGPPRDGCRLIRVDESLSADTAEGTRQVVRRVALN